MDMNFQSDPPLSRTQIISLITLRNADKHDSSLNSDDMNSLLGSGIRFTLNSLGVTQKLEDALSLDMLTVTIREMIKTTIILRWVNIYLTISC